jgi:hypothetical protein
MIDKGVHFLGLYRLRGKERQKLGFVELGKLESYLANYCVFRLGLGPILVDS